MLVLTRSHFTFYLFIPREYQWPLRTVFLPHKLNAQNILKCEPCLESAFADLNSLDCHPCLPDPNRKTGVCLGTIVSSVDRVGQSQVWLTYCSVSCDHATFIPPSSKALALKSHPVINTHASFPAEVFFARASSLCFLFHSLGA